MCAVAAGRWPRTIDDGFVILALVSPGSARGRTYEKGSELAVSGKSGLW